MGPIFNPFFWIMGIAVLCVSSVAAALIGAAVYAITSSKLKQRSDEDKPPLLAFAGLAGLVAFVCICLALSNVPFGIPIAPGFKPTIDDVLGTWQPTSGSLMLLADEGYENDAMHSVVFHEDGTVEITNMPDVWLSLREHVDPNKDYYSGEGMWEIVRYDSRWAVSVELEYDDDGIQRQTTRYLRFMGLGPPYTLYFIWGDPDSGDTFKLERELSSP
jgi:hypothetical protein